MSYRPQNFWTIQKRLKAAFTRERAICRLIAAWSAIAAITVLEKGDYSNLSFAQDTSLVLMLLAVTGLFILFSVVSMSLPRFETDSWFLLLGATVCVFKWIKTYEGNKTEFLVVLGILAAYALFLFYFVQRNEMLCNIIKPGNKTTMIVAIAVGLIGGTVIAVITCLRYMTFSAPNYDFGLFVNMFHNMKETGLPLVTSERDQLLSHFAVHISPIYYLLLPFYFVFPSPMTLQIGQAVALASGVIPVLLLARHFKLSGRTQIFVTLIYALYPAISAGCFYDIHENCFLAPLLLWMFYFFEKEKYIPMYIFAFAVLMVKEDAAMYIILFALYVLISRRKYIHGSILALGAVGYFVLALTLLTKYGDGVMTNRFSNLIFDSKDGLMGAIKTALVNPGYLLTQLFTTSKDTWDKVAYLLQMFLPLGFLPFITRRQSRWLLLAPMLMNLLTYYQYQYNIGFQYNFGVTAFLMYAMLVNLPDLQAPTRRNLVAFGAAACCCLYVMTVLPKWDQYTLRWKDGKDTYRQMEAILDTIPEDASLNVSTFLLSHVADRDVVYEIGYHKDKPDVDYVVIDARYMDNSARQHMKAYTDAGYTVHEEHEGLIVILKSPDS